MKRERVALQPAYILHHLPYRNTSMLIEAFTHDFGRVGLVARGVRTQRSRLSGVLQPFAPLLLSWSARGELGTLSAAEVCGTPLLLHGKTLFCGYYLNEILMRLLARHMGPGLLYQAYEQALSALAACAEGAAQERVLRLFEKRLLWESGYGLLLEREAESGRPIAPERTYRYQLEKGPLPDEETNAGVAVHGSTLLGLARDELVDARNLREAKHLMRAALALYLGNRPLKSREFYQQAGKLHPADG
jgi:DNA repair protein RecO (recombination protein O)